LGLNRLVAFASRDNRASIAVMHKLGCRFEGDQSIFGLDAVRHALTLDQIG